MDIGNKIDALIKESGESRKKIAKDIGITPSNLTQIINRNYKKLKIEHLEKLAKRFNKSVSYFVSSEDKEEAKKLNISEISFELVKIIESLDKPYRDYLDKAFLDQAKGLLQLLKDERERKQFL
ncbi:MAG: helix-turn-helix transcriptional regulator [Spirochaetes bacterium]|nr:helix-turn-helix transcriptional regulator [Spirochaetota bacterium]